MCVTISCSLVIIGIDIVSDYYYSAAAAAANDSSGKLLEQKEEPEIQIH
jgi:hypothetical protein